MKAIVGTAGHIDHGKTALVRTLTGIDTDRLPEEQRRGISIELGFAWMDLDGGDRVGFVDVPGHERFIGQMLAGAQGFDLLLLVVAADDGVMPQTEEHFEICHLLGVRKAVFVITKADLVDEARIRDVAGEIEILAAGTPFEQAPILAVSAQSGRGIAELRELIVRSLADLSRTTESGVFRMPVDRVFVIKGHGVVVTGTAAGGSVAPGDELTIEPAKLPARVREVQVHERSVDRAYAGQRVALNLSGVDRDVVARGDMIVAAGIQAHTDRLDAHVEIRPSAGKVVQSHTRVRVYLGTRDVAGRIVWLDGVSAVSPRTSAYAQVVLREETVAFAGDRFVLRDETASRTLGGGVVLVARARKHRTADGEVTPTLRVLEHGGTRERLLAFLRASPALVVVPAKPAQELGVPVDEIVRLAGADPAFAVLRDGAVEGLAAQERIDRCSNELWAAVRAHHEQVPGSAGVDLEALRQATGEEVEARAFRILVDRLVEAGRLVRRGSVVATPEHRVKMNDADEALAERVLAAIRRAPSMPPTFKQLEEELGAPARRIADVVAVLAERGAVVKVSSELAFARDAVEDIARRLRGHLEREREITAAGFRDLIGASRKYSIPLLDYFDRSGLTLRSGDVRRLRAP